MATPLFFDRVKETTTTTGTGTLTLAGAVAGFQSFAVVGDGLACHYMIFVDGGVWEVGIGTYTASGTTLSRTQVLANSSGTTSALTLAAGTKTVLLDLPAVVCNPLLYPVLPGGRISLSSTLAVPTSDLTAQTTLYYQPDLHSLISLWTGSFWKVTNQPSAVSQALGTLTSGKNYDVFAYYDTDFATMKMEFLVWTDDTTRATALAWTDSVYTKTGDKTRLYLGTFRTVSTTATTDAAIRRFVWNAFNRVERPLQVTESTSSWTYTTTAYRQVRATAGNRVEIVNGLQRESVKLIARNYGYNSLASVILGVGVGVDSTTVTSAYTYGGIAPLVSQGNFVDAHYEGYPGLGYHALNWLENSGSTTGTTTWVGTAAGALIQPGMIGRSWS